MATQQSPGSGTGQDAVQQEHMDQVPRETSSWEVLKDLRLSIVDSGVNALKRGMSRITGVFKTTPATEPSAREATPERIVPPTEANSVVEAAGVAGEPPGPSVAPSGARPSEQIRVAEQWIENLFDNLMSSVEPVRDEDSEGAIHPLGACHVEHNERQQITRITYPNAAWTTISYDDNDPSQARLVARGEGLEWRHEGASWYQYNHGRITGETICGAFEIRPDGEIVIRNAAGEEIERWFADGSIVESTTDEPDLIRDSAGAVKSRRYSARGGGEPITYDYANGQLIAAKTGDGQVWERTADGKWQRTGAIAQSLELSVSRQGDCVIAKYGEVIAVKHRDGSETEFKYTGDREIRKNGQVVEIVNSDGTAHHFGPREREREQAVDAAPGQRYPAPGM